MNENECMVYVWILVYKLYRFPKFTDEILIIVLCKLYNYTTSEKNPKLLFQKAMMVQILFVEDTYCNLYCNLYSTYEPYLYNCYDIDERSHNTSIRQYIPSWLCCFI